MSINLAAIKRTCARQWRNLLARLPDVASFLKQHWIITPLSVFAFIAFIVGYVNYSKEYNPLLKQAQSYLNIGLYNEAKTAFQKAIDTHPIRRLASLATIINDKAGQSVQQSLDVFDLTHEASLGLQKATLADSVAQQKPEAIAYQLKELAAENPNDGDLQVLFGKLALSHLAIEQAKGYYFKAIELNPNIAEAHFGLCSVYELEDKIKQAIEECEKAIKVSGVEPTNYKINLAGLYLQQGNDTKARELIAHLEGKYLPIKLELARIHLFTNELTDAINFQKEVLIGLNNSDVMKLPENQTIWYFKGLSEIILLKNLDDKKCYVTYSLALSSYLNNIRQETDKYLKDTAKLCSQHKDAIKNILRHDLEVAAKNSQLSKRLDEFEKRYLSK